MAVNSEEEKNYLTLMSWDHTKKAIQELKALLKCQACHCESLDPVSMGNCDHTLCSKCTSTLKEEICVICNVPSNPGDRKSDRITSTLLSSANDLLHLLNGGKICLQTGCEAPLELENKRFNPQSFVKASTSGGKSFKSEGNSEVKKSHEIISTTSKESKPPLSNIRTSLRGKAKSSINISLQKGTKSEIKPRAMLKERSLNTAVGAEPAKLKRIFKSKTTTSITSPIPTKNSSPKHPITPNRTKLEQAAYLKLFGLQCNSPLVNKRNTKGETPLHVACIKGDLGKIESLLSEGANPNTKDNAGWTPLHEASVHGHNLVVECLLKGGALVDVPGNNNETALHDAVSNGRVEVIQVLRKWGAGDEGRDLWGRTPRSIADLCLNPSQLHSALDTQPQKHDITDPKVPIALVDKMVLCGMDLSAEYKAKLDQVVRILNAKYANNFSTEVTHVVVTCNITSRLCSNSITYMMAVVSGKTIVSHEWLDQCVSVEGPKNPTNFEIRGCTEFPYVNAPLIARNNARKMLPGLFKGCHFYLKGIINEETLGLTRKLVEDLIKAGDGVLLLREPDPELIGENEQTVPYFSGPNSELCSTSHFILYCKGPGEPILKYNMKHIRSLPVTWLITCVHKCCIDLVE